MLRTHTCGELNKAHVGKKVILCGWVQKIRDKGGIIWVDLRDKYGITQLMLEEGESSTVNLERARDLGREYVVRVEGKVIERKSKNDKIPTGEIEILLDDIVILNPSKVPPFLIEDETDGGEDLRMEYRYLDIRRNPVRKNLELRHKVSQSTRKYLDDQGFIEVETPVLIKSTPEGARDFVVPSRLNKGEFYALPQSPQTFKQILMVAGMDKYYQIVKCFRDEDLRADRQPEFTQVDCEMSFVGQEDILEIFEGWVHTIFKEVIGAQLAPFVKMPYEEAMKKYGSDKPDLRFDMEFVELNELAQNKGFKIFDDAELVVGICAKQCAHFSRKQLDDLTDFVKKPQIGAKGLVYVKCHEDGAFKSSVDKFYGQDDLGQWAEKMNAEKGDLLLILSGNKNTTRKQLSALRLEMGDQLQLKDPKIFKGLWVVDFPLLEWDEESGRFHAMHHPFTSPKEEDIHLLDTEPGRVKANAYDMVINGVELGGGSIRIHDRSLQQKVFETLGFSKEAAQQQFGFLLDAFQYGAPPHGGIAFGLDRLCALLGGTESIRDYIAFSKNTSGRDVMIKSPSPVDNKSLEELGIVLKK